MKFSALLFLLIPMATEAANYSAKKAVIDGVDVVELGDASHRTQVTIVPSIGNLAYEMKVAGQNVFWVPEGSLGQLKAKPVLCGNPFLAPWANRIDQDAFFANGKKYLLNTEIGNLRRDGNQKPIHGLLSFATQWKVVKMTADSHSAEVTSRLEYWRYPDLMAQFPFAHNIEMRYRLADGVLEVETALENLSTDPMPVAIGYHPYFQVHDAPRDEWKAHLAARDHMELSSVLIPTGEHKPVALTDPVSLGGTQLDDVFGNLVRGTDGKAEFWVQGKKQKVSVIYGPKYTTAIAFAPPGKSFICFEPMAAITNGFNLAHAGIYKDLQSVPAGGTWRESFWIAPSGF